MMTSSGAICDICGRYILPITGDERINFFKLKGLDKELTCDNECKLILDKAIEKRDWTILPEGPLREVFEQNEE